MSKFRMISPNDMNNAAKQHMLDGCEPQSERDWMLLVNFWAANVQKGTEEPLVNLMARLYRCPLCEELLSAIAQFQANKKGKE